MLDVDDSSVSDGLGRILSVVEAETRLLFFRRSINMDEARRAEMSAAAAMAATELRR